MVSYNSWKKSLIKASKETQSTKKERRRSLKNCKRNKSRKRVIMSDNLMVVLVNLLININRIF